MGIERFLALHAGKKNQNSNCKDFCFTREHKKSKQEVRDDLSSCVLKLLPEVNTLPSLVVICEWRYFKSGDADFSNFHENSRWPRNKWSCGFIVGRYHNNFGLNSHCVSVYGIMDLICHVISQGHIIKGLGDFIGESLS